MKETLPWSICVAKENLVFQINDWENCNYELLFPQYNQLNKTKTITFKKPRSLSLLLVQENSNKTRQLIGVAQIESINLQLEEGYNWKSFQIIIVLTKNGLLELRAQATKYHAEMIDIKKNEEVLLTEKEITKDIQKMKKEIKKELWIKWKNKKILIKLEKKNKELSSESILETEIPKIKKTKIVKKLQKQEKKRYSKVTVPISFTTLTGLSIQTKQQIMDMETKMSQFDHDCLVQLTARNDLETYVLNAQSEFSNGGLYFEFMTSKESKIFINEIFSIDDWLNDDWEMNKTPSEYIEKLTKIKTIGDCYVLRYNEWQKRPLLLEMYNKQIIQIEIWLKDERHNTKYKHITDEKIKELSTHAKDESEWLSSKIKEHSNLVKSVDPPFLTENISKRIKESKLVFELIKNIPKPQSKKKKEENKAELEKKEKESTDKKIKKKIDEKNDK